MTFEEAFFDELEKHAGWKEKLLAGVLAGGALLGAGEVQHRQMQNIKKDVAELSDRYPGVSRELRTAKESTIGTPIKTFIENIKGEKPNRSIFSKPAEPQPKLGPYYK